MIVLYIVANLNAWNEYLCLFFKFKFITYFVRCHFSVKSSSAEIVNIF